MKYPQRKKDAAEHARFKEANTVPPIEGRDTHTFVVSPPKGSSWAGSKLLIKVEPFDTPRGVLPVVVEVKHVKAGSPLLLSRLRVGDVVSKVGGAYLLAKGDQNGITALVKLLHASPDQVVLQVARAQVGELG
jgi:hypothetical protein